MPWLADAWPRFAAQLQAKRHHAWLIHGPQGIGKWELALELARARLCSKPQADAQACGGCTSCLSLKFEAESETGFSHPDLVLLMPAKLREEKGIPLPLSAQKDDKKSASQEILVDDMRDAMDALALSAHHAQGRVCIVYPAEAMNAITANTLLKTLEEPPGDTLFLLVTHQPSALLPTIRSRCLSSSLAAPALSESLLWLTEQGQTKVSAQLALGLTGNRPLLAQQMLESGALLETVDKASQTGRWQLLQSLDLKTNPLVTMIPLIQRWLCDVSRVKSGGASLCYLQPEAVKILQRAAKAYSWNKLRELERSMNLAMRQARHPVNAGLMLDALLYDLLSNIGA